VQRGKRKKEKKGIRPGEKNSGPEKKLFGAFLHIFFKVLG
jgi:hypothetical protein